MSKDVCRKCGGAVEVGWVLCAKCRENADAERWAELPKAKWNGEGGIYSDAYDEYFWDEDAAAEWLADHDLTDWDELRLVICEPVYARPLSSDHWEDEISDEGEVPEWLEDAVEEFNKKLEGQAPLSYEPGNTAVDTSGWEIPKEEA